MEGGDREAISCSLEKIYHRNSRGIFTDIHGVGSLELVHASSSKRRLWNREAEEISKAETNEKEVR